MSSLQEWINFTQNEDGNFQIFSADPGDYVTQLYGLRQQYRNLYGV